MRLKIENFSLPPNVGIDSADAYAALTKRVEKIGKGSGSNSRRFEMRCIEFRDLCGSGNRVEDFATNKFDVRVVLHLWRTDANWRRWSEPTLESLKHLYKLAGGFRPARISALQDTYFECFDDLNQFEILGKFIAACLKRVEARKLLPNQKKLAESCDFVLTKNGPISVAKKAIAAGRGYEIQMNELGLGQYRSGRYAQACKNAYYVETFKELEIGDVHEIFNEVADSSIKESPYGEGLNLGQKVAHVLIRKCASNDKGMPEAWVDYVKRLLGDPRIPVRSESYQKWWAAMDREDEANMRRWLAGADLRLFLVILKESSTDEDLRRMYPARRKFLEGLLDGNDVVDARLFLSQRATAMIRKQYGPEALKAHGNLSDPHKSVIYVNVENKVHLFEGTHSFAARGGGVMPENHRTLSRAVKSFTYKELSTELDPELAEAGRRLLPKTPETIYVRHHPPIGWQANMILEFKYYGVTVNPEAVFTKSDYVKYRRDYGV